MASIGTNRDLFWGEVAKTTTNYSPESAVIVQGKRMADKAKIMQGQMFEACTRADRFAQRLFLNPPMKVLDLGAGLGANTLPMAKFGAHVTAIDQSEELLAGFKENANAIRCSPKNLSFIPGDITNMESYNGPFNLVVAVDILPYLSPTTLRSTMEKIQQCLEDRGILIGTIFTTDTRSAMREFMEQLGAHFYPNGREFVTQLLEYSGFTVVELEPRGEGGFRFKAEKTPVEMEEKKANDRNNEAS